MKEETVNFMTELNERRGKAETKLAGLRKKRGAATLDNKPFDANKITSLESELVAMDEADHPRARGRDVEDREGEDPETPYGDEEEEGYYESHPA